MATLLMVIFGMCACTGNENARRLGMLERDPVLHCHIVGVSDWDHIAATGTRNGIGFGGIAPTIIGLQAHLIGDAASVNSAARACATRAGWLINPRSASPTGFNATKQFERKWVATLVVGVGHHAYRNEPALSITIETDPV